MAKHYEHNVSAMARRADRIVRMNMKIAAQIAAAAEDPEQVKADAKKPVGEAPFYLHVAARFAQAVVKQASDQDARGGAALNVLIVGQAPTTAAWLDDVKALDVKAIEAVPTDKTEKK